MVFRFYVYIYLDPTKPAYSCGDLTFENLPFYVGKGKDSRDVYHLHCVKTSYIDNGYFFYRKIKSILDSGVDPIIIRYKENISENEAFSLEEKLINDIGRRVNNTGPLTNICVGGRGGRGVPWSEERKLKHSKLMSTDRNKGYKPESGKHWWYSASEEQKLVHRQRQSEYGRNWSESHKISVTNSLVKRNKKKWLVEYPDGGWEILECLKHKLPIKYYHMAKSRQPIPCGADGHNLFIRTLNELTDKERIYYEIA